MGASQRSTPSERLIGHEAFCDAQSRRLLGADRAAESISSTLDRTDEPRQALGAAAQDQTDRDSTGLGGLGDQPPAACRRASSPAHHRPPVRWCRDHDWACCRSRASVRGQLNASPSTDHRGQA
jgi:hypothetical protein